MPETTDAASQPPDVLQHITSLIRNIFGVDVAAVSLIRDREQRFKSIQGLALTAIPLEQSFCRATWRERRPIVIPDTAEDGEFWNHPPVTEKPSLCSYAGVLLKASDGEPMGTLCAIHGEPRTFTDRELAILNDLAFLAASELELREFATLDGLTGALTRRVFLKEGGRRRDTASHGGLEASVIVFDLDHFKAINDRYGHGAGDLVLRSVASACQANLRDRDLFGRLGGEEFAVLLEGGLGHARTVAERLRAAIADLQFTFAEQPVRVTASFGIASATDDQDALSQMLHRADGALYAAKGAGRNRTVTASAASPLMH